MIDLSEYLFLILNCNLKQKMLDNIKNRVIQQAPMWMVFLIIPLLQSNELLDQGMLIRFIGLQIVMLILLGRLLRQRKKLHQFSSPIFLIYFLFVIYSGIHLLWGNVFSDSVFEWYKTSSYFLLLLLLVQSYSFEELKSGIPVYLSLLGVILALLGSIELVQSLQNGKISIPLDTYQIKTVFGHRNLYLQVLFLTFPFQLYLSAASKIKSYRWVYTFFSVLTLFLLIVLSNRSVWLVLVLGIGTLIVIFFLHRKKRLSNVIIERKNLKFILFSLFVAVIMSGFFFTFFTETTEAEKHFSNIVKIENGSGKDRLELWKRTIKLIEEKPLLGHGSANWKIEMLKYGNKGLISEDNITFYQRPHNDYLWIFSEYGIIGGLLYLMLFLWTFVSLLKQLNSRKHIKNILFFYAVLFALIGFVVFSFFSFPHERIVQNILLSTFFAIIISGKDIQTYFHKQKVSKSVFFLIAAVFILSSIFFAYQRFVSESHTRKALLAKSKNQHSLVIAEIEKAISPYYVMDPLSTPLWWYKGLAYYEKGRIDSAIRYFSKAYEINPYHVHVLNNLASSYGQKGETDKAIDFYKKVLKIYPGFEESSLNLCAVYFNSGDTDNALLTLKNINIESTNPRFKTFVKTVLKEKIIEIHEEQSLVKTSGSLPDDEEWYFALFKSSIANDIPIEMLIFETSKSSENINLKNQ